MTIPPYRVAPVSVPAESGISHVYPATDLADAYSIDLPAGASTSPEVLARYIFSQQAFWASGLMVIRDALVAGFGLKTSRQLRSASARTKENRVGIFRVYSASATEIVLGEDDRHLDFRLSLLCQGCPSASGTQRVIVSTVVHCHNLLGRTYLFLIAPFHRLIVQSSLRQAARMGWPRAAPA